MTFFNKKEEVYELRLTRHGRQKFAVGALKPTHYEFFDDEVERHYFKTGIFTGDDGEIVFVPLTKNYLAKRKAAKTSGKKRPKGLSWKDRKLLRGLKK